ncbi:MAG: HAD family phosphatase [Candidatus Diapherotrites archaeon]|nr:HAD family phosphatase [Candidatus Diapherotrites archaeon]
MGKFISDSFLKEMITVVLFGFVVLKLELFTFGQVVNGIFLVGIIYVLAKLFRGFKNQKAVLFDFGGVVAEGDYFTEPMRIRKGIPQLVNSLKKKNYKIALLTNQNAEVADFLSKRYGLNRLFSEQIVSGKVGIKKPDKAIYSYALNRLKVRPKDTFFIDDSEENVLGARKLGIKGIRFQSVEQVAKSVF